MRKTIALVASMLTASAFAASSANTVSTDSASFYDKLKESPLSLNVLSEWSTDNNTYLETLNIAYVGFKISDKDSIRLENRWQTAKGTSDAEMTSKFSREVLKYKRSGILTEEKHGTNLSAALEQRWYPQKEKLNRNQYGLTRISTTASNTIGNLDLSNTLYFASIQRRNKLDDSTGKNYIYLVTSQSYNVTDKFSLGLVQEFFHQNAADADGSNLKGEPANNYDEVLMTVAAGYQINDTVSAEVSAATKIMGSNDGQTFAEDLVNKIGYAAAISISAF